MTRVVTLFRCIKSTRKGRNGQWQCLDVSSRPLMNMSLRFLKMSEKFLEKFRRVIRESVPKAEETTSYGMPAFKLNGRILVYFAGWKSHIGFYPAGHSAIEAFEKELSSYKQSRGTVQFPLDKPIPFDLVRKIVKFRVKETESKKK